MAKNLVDTKKIEKKIEKKIDQQKSKVSRATKTKSPTKPKARGRATRRRGVFDLEDSDLVMIDSDLAMPLTTSSLSQREPRQSSHQDHNTIVLDCDDAFIGGPAMVFSRNLAEADAISIEDSQGLNVNVKIFNNIEQYSMNPVS